MVIAPKDFRDEELIETRQALLASGIHVTVASLTLKDSKGMFGLVAKPDIELENAKSSDYDAIVLVGGTGAKVYFDNPKAHSLAREFDGARKVVSAICIAPVILAKAGILNGKTATVWDDKGHSGPFWTHLKNGGAIFSGDDVVRDGRIVTANGPSAATRFGRMIVETIG